MSKTSLLTPYNQRSLAVGLTRRLPQSIEDCAEKSIESDMLSFCHVPRDAHSEPLLAALRLESLESRRNSHAVRLIDAILAGSAHPALTCLFNRDSDGRIVNSSTARTGLGGRRFSVQGKNIYNNLKNSPLALAGTPGSEQLRPCQQSVQNDIRTSPSASQLSGRHPGGY